MWRARPTPFVTARAQNPAGSVSPALSGSHWIVLVPPRAAFVATGMAVGPIGSLHAIVRPASASAVTDAGAERSRLPSAGLVYTRAPIVRFPFAQLRWPPADPRQWAPNLSASSTLAVSARKGERCSRPIT